VLEEQMMMMFHQMMMMLEVQVMMIPLTIKVYTNRDLYAQSLSIGK